MTTTGTWQSNKGSEVVDSPHNAQTEPLKGTPEQAMSASHIRPTAKLHTGRTSATGRSVGSRLELGAIQEFRFLGPC